MHGVYWGLFIRRINTATIQDKRRYSSDPENFDDDILLHQHLCSVVYQEFRSLTFRCRFNSTAASLLSRSSSTATLDSSSDVAVASTSRRPPKADCSALVASSAITSNLAWANGKVRRASQAHAWLFGPREGTVSRSRPCGCGGSRSSIVAGGKSMYSTCLSLLVHNEPSFGTLSRCFVPSLHLALVLSRLCCRSSRHECSKAASPSCSALSKPKRRRREYLRTPPPARRTGDRRNERGESGRKLCHHACNHAIVPLYRIHHRRR